MNQLQHPREALGPLADTIEESLWFGDEDLDHTTARASASLAAAVAEAAGLKAFPPVATELIAILDTPEYRSDEVKRLIETDPGLATRVVAVANSAAFAARSNCASVNDALVRLGGRTVRDIVSGLAVVAMYDLPKKGKIARLGKRIRSHCVGVGAIARTFARLWGYKNVEQVFLSGLLHDVGKLMSLQCAEINYADWPREVLEVPNQMHLRERLETGYDHAVLGGHVLSLWKLPTIVQQSVAWHHQPGRAYEIGGEVGLMVALMRVADSVELRIASNTGYDDAWGEDLVNDGTLGYAGFNISDLREHWSTLVRSRDEMTRVIDG